MYLHGWCVNMVWMYNPTSWVQVLIDAGFSSYYIRGLPYSFIPVLFVPVLHCGCENSLRFVVFSYTPPLDVGIGAIHSWKKMAFFILVFFL